MTGNLLQTFGTTGNRTGGNDRAGVEKNILSAAGAAFEFFRFLVAGPAARTERAAFAGCAGGIGKGELVAAARALEFLGTGNAFEALAAAGAGDDHFKHKAPALLCKAALAEQSRQHTLEKPALSDPYSVAALKFPR